jgi:hypothetical protein
MLLSLRLGQRRRPEEEAVPVTVGYMYIVDNIHLPL